MKKIILFLSIFSFCFSQEKVSLEKYIEIAVKQNSGLKPLEETINNSAIKIEQSKSAYYPQLSLSGSYTRMSLFSEMTIPFNGKMMTFQFGVPNNYSTKATVSQQIFNWGRTAKTVELNFTGVESANTGLEMNKFLIAYQVIPLFYGTIFLNESTKIMDNNIKLFKDKLEILRKRFQEGLASNFDVSLIEYQINSIKSQKEDLFNSIHKNKINYNRLANRRSDESFDPIGELEYISLDLTKENLVKSAFADRLEFRQLQQQEDLTRTQIELTKTNDKPNLNFIFNYEFRNGFMPEMDKIQGNWNAIFSFSYPVFDGFKTKYAVEEGRSNLKIINARKEDFEQSLSADIEQTLSDIKTVENKISIEKEKITHSETALKIADDRYKNGLISTTDLIEAQNNYGNARLNYIQLVYTHTLYKYNLYRIIGKKLY
jgi:outer membrane protein